MNLGNGFPNEPLEWILAILLAGLAFAVYRRLFNMLLCGFGLTRSRRIIKAESFVGRYSAAIADMAESPDPMSLNDEDERQYLDMLQENLAWALDCLEREQSRHIWDKLDFWKPPRPTAAEILRSPAAQTMLALNREPVSEYPRA